MKKTKKPMPKGDALKSNKAPFEPMPAGKFQMPAKRTSLGGKKKAGKAGY